MNFDDDDRVGNTRSRYVKMLPVKLNVTIKISFFPSLSAFNGFLISIEKTERL